MCFCSVLTQDVLRTLNYILVLYAGEKKETWFEQQFVFDGLCLLFRPAKIFSLNKYQGLTSFMTNIGFRLKVSLIFQTVCILSMCYNLLSGLNHTFCLVM